MESCAWWSGTNVENNDAGTLLQRDGRATEATREEALWLWYCVVRSNTVIIVLAAVWNKVDTVEENAEECSENSAAVAAYSGDAAAELGHYRRSVVCSLI